MNGQYGVDYTISTKRLGARTPHGKLVKCPKCGKKGALAREEGHSKFDGKVWPAEVVHAQLTPGVLMSGEYCWVPLSEQGQRLRGVKHLFEFLRQAVRLSVIEDFAKRYPEYNERGPVDKNRGYGPLVYRERISVPVFVLHALLERSKR